MINKSPGHEFATFQSPSLLIPRFIAEAANLFVQREESSEVRPAPSMMLFKVPIGIGLLPCIADDHLVAI